MSKEKYQSETSVDASCKEKKKEGSTIRPNNNDDEQLDKVKSGGRTPVGSSVRNRLQHSGSTDHSMHVTAAAAADRPRISVQRSKSDVRHNNSRPAMLKEMRRGSNFELAYLLQKGRTLDAKLFGEEYAEEDEEDHPPPRLRRGSSGDDGNSSPAGSRSGVGGAGGVGGGRTVLLPLRLRHALTKRRLSSSSSSRIYPPRTSICGSLQGSTVSISGPLDSLPELHPSEMLTQQSVTVTCSEAQKEKDIEAAIIWLQQEINSLKTQDRKLFRQLLGLGTEIHRMSGMKTCQSVNNSLDDDADVVTLRFIENEANENYVDHIGRHDDDDDDFDDDYLTQSMNDASSSSSWQKKKSNSEANNLKNNKLLDLYSSTDSFFL